MLGTCLLITFSFLDNLDNFVSAGNCLMLYSSLSASLFVISGLIPTNSTGLLDLVYLAPLPELCSINRILISLLIPQYKDLSEHRTR